MTNSKPSDFTHADFELNDKVVKRVSGTLRHMGYHIAADWLDSQIHELGLPMIVNNASTTFHRIQKYWKTAIIAFPCIPDCGNLVLRAFRNGDRSMPFHITDEEAYNPEAHAVAATRAIPSPSPVRPLDRPMFLDEIQDNPILHPGCPTYALYPTLPPEPQSDEPVIKCEETPAAPTVDVSYSATIKTADGTQVVHFTSATKDDVMKTVEDYVECCRQGNTIEYSTFALVRDFVAKNMGVDLN
ncbi:uncharacterized protein J3D65DRAFT_39294 [Phyllosticta citribraziliensis]|uniref:UBX domain-containing protein n=1 Tax=Phyllosticta citribraziliensis TaxID=989973 RepID=A0ABR1MC72_9PEZI